MGTRLSCWWIGTRRWRVSVCCRPMAVHPSSTAPSTMACATSSCRERPWIQSMCAIQRFLGKLFKFFFFFFKYHRFIMHLWSSAWPKGLWAENKYFYKPALSWCSCCLSYDISVLKDLCCLHWRLYSLKVCLLYLTLACHHYRGHWIWWSCRGLDLVKVLPTVSKTFLLWIDSRKFH